MPRSAGADPSSQTSQVVSDVAALSFLPSTSW